MAAEPRRGEEREIELAALARLGLASRIGDHGELGGPSLVESLVKSGRIRGHQAEAVRAYVAMHAVTCACGQRSLAPEESRSFACTACGASLVKSSGSGSWVPAPKKFRLPGVGDRIGPLVVLATLGKGAHGVVYRVRHSELGRESALKLLPHAATDDRKRKRFSREVEALARLHHPGIVKVHAAFEHEGSLACEMELVAGKTLEDVPLPLPWRQAAELVVKISDAVQHAHSAGVLHRDLKPANVLLRAEDGQPLVADFGLARLDDQQSSLTRPGAYVGTPVYMAPEAFSGSSGPGNDVYGLGAILYHLLAGKAPFEETSPFALFHKIAQGLCEPTRAPGAPAALDRVRARAMAVKLEDRYATAGELARDLERVLRGERIEGAPRSGRRRTLLAGLGLVLVLVAAGTLLARRPGARPGPEPPAPVGSASPLDRARDDLLQPERRAAALKALAALGDDALVGTLDSAVLAKPADAGLRKARAQTRQRLGRAIDVSDLAAADPADADLLALAAQEHGLRGPDPLAQLRALRGKRPGSKPLATLFAVEACASGDVSLGAEVADAFRAGGAPASARAQLFARVLASSAQLAATVEAGKVEGATPSLARRLAEDLRVVARDAPRAVRVVMSPMERPFREGFRQNRLGDAADAGVRPYLLQVLEAVPRDLAPTLRALRAALGDIDRHPFTDDPAELAASARELSATDPLLAAFALELAAQHAQKDADAFEWIAAAIACSDRSKPGSEFEGFLIGQIERRCCGQWASREDRLAGSAPDPATARAHLEEALSSRRRALAVARRENAMLRSAEREAVEVLKLLFRLGREAEGEELLPAVRQGEAFRAEILRRRGDARGAIELARFCVRIADADWLADALAARALAEADLGLLDEARASVAKLVEAEKIEGPILEDMRAAAVSAYVAKRASR